MTARMLACGSRARCTLVGLCALALAHADCEPALAESSAHAHEREASGAAPETPPAQSQAPPVGNQSTAKWRVFTDMSRDFVKQVCEHSLVCLRSGASFACTAALRRGRENWTTQSATCVVPWRRPAPGSATATPTSQRR